MKRVALVAAAFFTLGDAGVAPAQFINGPPAGEEIVTIHLKGGLLVPMSTFDDRDFGETSYANGFAIGVGVSAWPAFDRRVGVKVNLLRSHTDGVSDFEWAPIVVNSPRVWLFSTELAARLPVGNGYPYLSVGYGMKQYSWVNVAYKADRDGTLTGSVGYEQSVPAFGGIMFNAELRGYRSSYRAFGVNDRTHEFGPLGGIVGGVPNLDLLITTGLSLRF